MFCADYDYDTLWFLAKESKPVRTESMGNRVVNVAFACPEEKIYASVTGLAQLVEDDKLVKALAPRNGLLVSCRILTLLRIDIQHAEAWDSDSL